MRIDEMGWPDKFDKLEELAGPDEMPYLVSLRADVELIAAAALNATDALRETRRELLDIIAMRQEHRVG